MLSDSRESFPVSNTRSTGEAIEGRERGAAVGEGEWWHEEKRRGRRGRRERIRSG
jgi:hypothetical protein